VIGGARRVTVRCGGERFGARRAHGEVQRGAAEAGRSSNSSPTALILLSPVVRRLGGEEGASVRR
jgi:hypothetical protein